MVARGHIPRLCVHSTKQKAYVRLNGRFVYLGSPDAPETLQRYNRVIAEWLQAGNTYLRPDERPSVSVNEVVLAYRRYAEMYYVGNDGMPTMELSRINLALRPVVDMYGLTPAENFGPRALRAIQQSMIDAGLSRLTINCRINVIRRAFKWAVAQEHVPPAVYHGLQAVEGLRRGRSKAKEARPVKPVLQATIEATMRFLPPVVQAMVQIHELTGMRSGELCQMRPCDIDTKDPQKWLYRPSHHKTENHGHERVITIGPRAQKILSPLLPKDLQAYIFTPLQAQKERSEIRRAKRKTPVQPSQLNRRKRFPSKKLQDRYTTVTYRRAIAYAAQRAIEANLLPPETRWHPHQLRHNCATLIRRKFGLDAARAVLGHSSVNQSAEYAEMDVNLAIEVAQSIG